MYDALYSLFSTGDVSQRVTKLVLIVLVNSRIEFGSMFVYLQRSGIKL